MPPNSPNSPNLLDTRGNSLALMIPMLFRWDDVGNSERNSDHASAASVSHFPEVPSYSLETQIILNEQTRTLRQWSMHGSASSAEDRVMLSEQVRLMI